MTHQDAPFHVRLQQEAIKFLPVAWETRGTQGLLPEAAPGIYSSYWCRATGTVDVQGPTLRIDTIRGSIVLRGGAVHFYSPPAWGEGGELASWSWRGIEFLRSRIVKIARGLFTPRHYRRAGVAYSSLPYRVRRRIEARIGLPTEGELRPRASFFGPESWSGRAS
jgi:hypothetical protein